MYTGPYHKMCAAYARTLVNPSAVYILSAKYGLLTLDQEIEPYDLRMGDRGCVTVPTVLLQAATLNLLDKPVIGLGGKEYVRVMRAVWPGVELPVPSLLLGKQLAWMKGRITGSVKSSVGPATSN